MSRFLLIIIYFLSVSTYAQILPSYQATHVKKRTSSCSSSETTMSLPNPSGGYSGNARGYYFTAPIDFCITGVKVPTTLSSDCQSVAILKFTSGAPPTYSSSTNAFDQLHYSSCVAGDNIIEVDISVSQGDIIGIYGCRSNGCINSYGSNSGFGFTIGGQAVTVKRSGMQYNLKTTQMQNVWYENFSSISRVEMYYKY